MAEASYSFFLTLGAVIVVAGNCRHGDDFVEELQLMDMMLMNENNNNFAVRRGKGGGYKIPVVVSYKQN